MIIATAVVCAVSPANAAEASCSDYLAAIKEDRALFDGFIYGYVTAKMRQKGDVAINAATIKVKRMTEKYCRASPEDRVSSVIGVFAETAAREP